MEILMVYDYECRTIDMVEEEKEDYYNIIWLLNYFNEYGMKLPALNQADADYFPPRIYRLLEIIAGPSVECSIKDCLERYFRSSKFFQLGALQIFHIDNHCCELTGFFTSRYDPNGDIVWIDPIHYWDDI